MKNLIFLFTLLFLSGSLFGQWTYTATYNPEAGNPNSLNAETDATTTGWTIIHNAPASVNAWSPVTTIPFPFNFYGMPVTDFVVSWNGVLSFDVGSAGTAPGPNANLPAATGLPNMTICNHWDEFTTTPPTGTNDHVYTKVFGSTPNRQLWIKWFSFEMGNPTASFNYFSIVLEESTDNIYMVDHYGISSPALTATVGVQLDPTTAVQFGNDQIALTGNGTSVADNDYYLFVPTPLFVDDAGITAIVNPTIPLSTGVQNIDVELKNIGINDLNSVDIQWEIDGVLQTPTAWTSGPLVPNGTTTVTLGSYNFPNGFTSLKAWTEMPNATMDNYMLNDTSEVLLCTAIQGTFTVGGAGADFVDLTSAVSALGCGISGPVVFNVNPGNYFEALIIPEVAGASATNTITFDGGSNATTSIGYDSGLGDNAVIQLDGADHIIIKNFTIDNKGLTDAWGVFLWHQANHNTISDCIFVMDPTPGAIDVISIVASDDLANDLVEGDNCNFLTVENCVFNGGEMGIHLEGLGLVASDFANGNRILNNMFLDQDDYGIYLDNQDSIDIIGNTVRGLKSQFSDGIYTFDLMNFRINENNINAVDYGIYIADGNYDDPPTQVGEIINNMVASETDYAMYFTDLQFTKIIHNTAYGKPGIRIGLNMDGLEIINNIFASDSDYAFETDAQLTINKMDFNLYYTPPTNSNFVKFGTAVYPDLAAWQTGSPGFNPNSVSGDPKFVSVAPPNFDLHVTGVAANDIADPGPGIAVDIDGDARPLSPSTVPDIGADEYLPTAFDASLVALVSPVENTCGSAMVPIEAEIYNLGSAAITAMDVHVAVTGTVTSNFTYNFSGSIASNQTQSVVLGNISVPNGGVVDLTIISDLTGDSNTANDTIMESVLIVSPNTPAASNQVVCAGSVATLFPNPFDPGVVYGWFDSPGGNLLAVDTFVTPPLSNNTTYYLAQIVFELDSVTTTFAGGNGCSGGNMFNITNLGTLDYEIDAFDLNFSTTGTSNATFHYIPNGTYLGNETNAPAWTLLTTETVNVTASGGPTHVPLTTSVTIPAGATYAIYVEYAANYTTGATVVSNGVFSLDMGAGLCSPFGGVNNGRTFNGTVYYKVIDLTGTNVCNSTVVPVDVTINPNGPSVNLGPDQTLCTGTSFVLDPSAAGLTYLWSTGETTQMITNTLPGIYWVQVFDPACGNTPITDTIEIFNYPDIAGSPIQVTDASCAGNDGSIDMLIIGGTPPYTFLWSDGQTTEDASGLAPGNYMLSVTDSNNCTFVSFSVTINAAPGSVNLSSTFTDVSCNGAADGAIDITVTGGTPPITYLWSNGATTEDISGLSGGTYTVTISDSQGCGNSTSVTISEATALSASGTSTDETTVGANDGTITVGTVIGGTPPYSISWSNGQTTFSISNLAPGMYTGVITDSVGCVFTVDYTINPATSSISDIDELISVELYPNPSFGNAVLAFTLTERKDISIEIVNAIGQVIKTIQLPDAISEEVDLKLDTYSSGTYFVKVGIEGNYFTKKLTLINR